MEPVTLESVAWQWADRIEILLGTFPIAPRLYPALWDVDATSAPPMRELAEAMTPEIVPGRILDTFTPQQIGFFPYHSAMNLEFNPNTIVLGIQDILSNEGELERVMIEGMVELRWRVHPRLQIRSILILIPWITQWFEYASFPRNVGFHDMERMVEVPNRRRRVPILRIAYAPRDHAGDPSQFIWRSTVLTRIHDYDDYVGRFLYLVDHLYTHLVHRSAFTDHHAIGSDEPWTIADHREQEPLIVRAVHLLTGPLLPTRSNDQPLSAD